MRFFFVLATLLLTTSLLAQKPIKKKKAIGKSLTHQDIFNQKMRIPVQAALADDIVVLGRSFLKSSYPKSTTFKTQYKKDGSVVLQSIEKEVLVINLKFFDCVTFVENMVALAQTRAKNSKNFDIYKKNVQNIRYRNGVIDYAARLHYFSDWIYENEKRGVVKNITKQLGGILLEKNINYMTSKKDTLYGNLADNTTFAAMQEIESNISKREKWYIPKENVQAIENQLKDGDIIGITNRLDGMDMAHVGMVIHVGGQVKMLHASSQYQKVIITEGSLFEYIRDKKAHTGIMVARLVESN
jgi:Protein of unknown function (DUF1460)